MNYSKMSKLTEVHVTNLTVDVHLPGFDLTLLRNKKIPKRRMLRMKRKTGATQKLDDAPELPREYLEARHECTLSYEAPHKELGDKCKTIIIKDKETEKELRVRSKFFLNI